MAIVNSYFDITRGYLVLGWKCQGFVLRPKTPQPTSSCPQQLFTKNSEAIEGSWSKEFLIVLLFFSVSYTPIWSWVLRVNQLLTGVFFCWPRGFLGLPNSEDFFDGGFSNSKLKGPHHWIMSWLWRWVCSKSLISQLFLDEIREFADFSWQDNWISNPTLGKSHEITISLGEIPFKSHEIIISLGEIPSKFHEITISWWNHPVFSHVFFPESQRDAEVLGALLRGEAPEQVAKFVATRVHLEVGFLGTFQISHWEFPTPLGFPAIFHLQTSDFPLGISRFPVTGNFPLISMGYFTFNSDFHGISMGISSSHWVISHWDRNHLQTSDFVMGISRDFMGISLH